MLHRLNSNTAAKANWWGQGNVILVSVPFAPFCQLAVSLQIAKFAVHLQIRSMLHKNFSIFILPTGLEQQGYWVDLPFYPLLIISKVVK